MFSKGKKKKPHIPKVWGKKQYKHKNSLFYLKPMLFIPFSLGQAKNGQQHTDATFSSLKYMHNLQERLVDIISLN